MSDDNELQPSRPPVRRAGRYAALSQEITFRNPVAETRAQKDLFTMTIIATANEGGTRTDEDNFVMNVIFKPDQPGLKLPPAITQLLLSYIGEILGEIEDEEKAIIEEQKASGNKEALPCK